MSMAHFNATVLKDRKKPGNKAEISGSDLSMVKTDQEIGIKEQIMQTQINPRQNIIQARSYLHVQELNSPQGGGETPLGSHSNKSGRPTDGLKSPTTDKSTRRLLTDMDKTKKKLLEKGVI